MNFCQLYTSSFVGVFTFSRRKEKASCLTTLKLRLRVELFMCRSMDAFRGEYEKLFGMLEKAHGNEIK